MNMLLATLLVFIIAIALLESTLSILNLKNQPQKLPKEFTDIYSEEKYLTSLSYHKETTKLSLINKGISTMVVVFMFIAGIFNKIDLFARGFGVNEIATGLIFYAVIAVVFYIIGLPFQIYSTFVIEEKYGFNKTTPKTYLLDTIKGTLLTLLLGGPLVAIILMLFGYAGEDAWIYCWIFTIIFSLCIQIIAPIVIMPLFNKFTPIEDGNLKDDITQYANDQDFAIKGIFTMDGSKRSTKLNAFFTGLGKYKKIALFDTLLEKLSNQEVLAVLAHEVGHSKKKHQLKTMLLSMVHTGTIFFLLSLLLQNPNFTSLLGMTKTSVYATLFFFGYFFGPINFILAIFFNMLSRKHEFEADLFAAETTNSGKHLSSALKKLSSENMATLCPHPLYVISYYSHPPVRERLKALERIDQKS